MPTKVTILSSMGRIINHEQSANFSIPLKKYFNLVVGLEKLVKRICAWLLQGYWREGLSPGVLESPFFRNRYWNLQFVQFG